MVDGTFEHVGVCKVRSPQPLLYYLNRMNLRRINNLLLKVVSHSVMYLYMCRLDAGRCHWYRVVNIIQTRRLPPSAVHFAAFVAVPVDTRSIAVPVVSVIMSR